MTHRVLVFGGGQLGQMLARAGKAINVDVTCMDEHPDACAGRAGKLICGKYTDPATVQEALANVTVATAEWENVPEETLRMAESAGKKVRPSPDIFAIARDRCNEKKLAGALGIPRAQSWNIQNLHELTEAWNALERLGATHGLIKRRTGGYDGKGQKTVRGIQDALDACEHFGWENLILEEHILFGAECSLISARSATGEIRHYPLTKNEHREGILWTSTARPRDGDLKLQHTAEYIANNILRQLSYIGILAMEFFLRRDGKLILNEIAPRVHNSGHWTIEGAETSQFENHLRAILGMPLGLTDARGFAGMVNIIGQLPPMEELRKRVPRAYVHLYGKEPRPGRKLGHITICCETGWKRDETLSEITRLYEPAL